MKNKGFTLVELSVVLIVIGLLVGGIMSGTSIIRQAKIRGLISETNELITAIANFKTLYNALPGDIPNATTFWSGTGNGNGDGQVLYIETVTGNGPEWLRVWDHLILAEMMPNKIVYSGTFSTSSVPAARSTNTLWEFAYGGPLYKSGPYNFIANNFKLSTADMFILDTKIDDGKASTGKLLGLGPNPYTAGFCTDVYWTNPVANYVLPDPNNYQACRMYYGTPF